MLWSGSETPEHQQVRFRNTRTPAGCEHTPRKTHAKKLYHVTFGTHKKQTLLWSGSETPMPKNSFTSPLEPIKNNNKKQCFGTVPKHPNWSGSETPEHYSRARQAKRMPKDSFTSPLEPIKNNALVRFRNTRTPAGPANA